VARIEGRLANTDACLYQAPLATGDEAVDAFVAWSNGQKKTPLTPETAVAVARRLAGFLDGDASDTTMAAAYHSQIWQRNSNPYAGNSLALMAPEIIAGKPSVPAASGVYSLGCLLYWMLSGKAPFGDDPPIEVMLRHLRDPAPATEIHSQLVAAMMAKDPAARPSPAQLLGQL
jgi:serine/threonine protein kinase